MDYQHLLASLREIHRRAGETVMEIYQLPPEEQGIRDKSQNDPVTAADMAANAILVESLQTLTPELPIVSEELVHQSFAERQSYSAYWLIDPIDGTKDFIQQTDEFSILTALIIDRRPVLGVLYAPALREMAWAAKGYGAWYAYDQQAPQPLRIQEKKLIKGRPGYRFVVSRTHPDSAPDFEALGYPQPVLLPTGSAIKHLRIAQNEADAYLRQQPVHEWDLATGQIIVEEAGGSVLQYDCDEPVQYTTENLKTPSFRVVRWCP